MVLSGGVGVGVGWGGVVGYGFVGSIVPRAIDVVRVPYLIDSFNYFSPNPFFLSFFPSFFFFLFPTSFFLFSR